jgi:signal transduction histidine kinase/DNA-binding response OmpR family regulator
LGQYKKENSIMSVETATNASPNRLQSVVMIVDDDFSARLQMKLTLENEGLTIIEAESGLDAINQFREKPVDLVPLDVMMPNMDGFDTCREIRNLPGGAHTPVVMVTGLDDAENITRAFNAGATDFISKPINFLIIGYRVRYWLRSGATLNELRKSQKQLSRAQDIARLGHWERNLDHDDFKLTCQNPAIFGISDPCDYDSLFAAIVVEDKKHARKLIEDACQAELGFSVQYRITLKNGSERIILNQGEVFRRESTQDRYAVGIIQDITEQKRAEEEQKLLQHHLQQAQKMEAVGTLAGGIAHDFNNILGAILGYAEMAYEDSLSGSVKPSDLNQVVQACHRAKNLVKQILAFSRQTETQKIPMRPSEIVKESIKLLRSSIPTTIDIRQDIDSETNLILADPTQIQQVIMNLCANAYHAMEEKDGTLSVALKNTVFTERDLVAIPNAQPGDFVQFSIGDTGSGIAPEIRERIFDPYFTTKETGKGTGMGLAIVHGIVNSCGGFISCNSEIGAGTVFKINLPAILEQTVHETKEDNVIPVGTERILFIDDEEMLAKMGQTMLERLGYKVTTMMSSIEALTAFKNQPDTFDLVITDQTMPGMTGFDMARRMLQIRPAMPIILCTGYSNQISEDKVKSDGIKGFTMKPLARKNIANMIRKILDEV